MGLIQVHRRIVHKESILSLPPVGWIGRETSRLHRREGWERRLK